jgi:hypothetical protein
MDSTQASINDLEQKIYEVDYGTIPQVILSHGGSSGMGAVYPNVVWGASPSVTSAIDWNPVQPSTTIKLDGPDADIKINGESLMTTLRGIQDRLNILRPNQELEAEWDQLRELGEQYRKLEQELEEKSRVWAILNK